jgi:hypothetical protein
MIGSTSGAVMAATIGKRIGCDQTSDHWNQRERHYAHHIPNGWKYLGKGTTRIALLNIAENVVYKVACCDTKYNVIERDAFRKWAFEKRPYTPDWFFHRNTQVMAMPNMRERIVSNLYGWKIPAELRPQIERAHQDLSDFELFDSAVTDDGRLVVLDGGVPFGSA